MLLSWKEHNNFSFDQGMDRGGGERVRGEAEYTLTRFTVVTEILIKPIINKCKLPLYSL